MGRARQIPTAERQLRQRIAHEAARLLAEMGDRDYALAKRKAAHRLGINEARHLPGNDEIEAALVEYLRLFQSDRHPPVLQHLRRQAVAAMRLLKLFQPRLVGEVLQGTAGPHTPITLHVFAETPEEVAVYLHNARIPFEQRSKCLIEQSGDSTAYPLYCWLAQNVSVQLLVLPMMALRWAARDPIGGGPLKRASLAEVEKMVS